MFGDFLVFAKAKQQLCYQKKLSPKAEKPCSVIPNGSYYHAITAAYDNMIVQYYGCSSGFLPPSGEISEDGLS